MRRSLHNVRGFGLALCLFAGGCKNVAVRNSETASRPPGPAAAMDRKPRSGPDLNAHESADACIAVARELQKARRDQEAIALYKRALEFDRANEDVIHRLACLSARTGEDEAARTYFESALREHPQDPQLMNDYGYFLFTRGQYKAAERQQRQAIALAPKSQLFQSNLAMTLAAMLQYDESLEIFERLVGSAAGRSNLAVLMARNGDAERAEKMLNDASVIDPSITQTEVVAQWLATSPNSREQLDSALPASFTTVQDPAPPTPLR